MSPEIERVGHLTDADKPSARHQRLPMCGWSVTLFTDAAAYSATVAHLEEVHGGGGKRLARPRTATSP